MKGNQRINYFQKFKTEDNFYIYSTFLSKIFQLSSEIYNLLDYLSISDNTNLRNIISKKYSNAETINLKLEIIKGMNKKLHSTLKPKRLEYHLNNKKIEYEFICGIDYRFLTKEIAEEIPYADTPELQASWISWSEQCVLSCRS